MAQVNSTTVTSNISTSPGESPHPSLDSRSLVPVAVLSICFLLGFPGNIAVIILKPNWENMSSLSQSLMLNLAVSDLLCLVTLPLWIYVFLYGWPFSLVACKLITYLGYCSIYASLLTVTVLSVQRYLQVVHLQRCLNQVKARKLVVPLWLASTLSIPALVVQWLDIDQHRTCCKPHYPSKGQRVAVLLTGLLVGVVSFSVMAFSYISLYRKVNQATFFNNPQTTRLITSIIVTVFVLWVPYRAMKVVDIAAVSLNNKSLLKFCEDPWSAFASVTFINSAVNPLLYAFTSNCLFTLCQKNAEHLVEKFKFPQNLSKSTDVTAEAAPQC